MVNFRSEHQFLVAVSTRGFIIGGLFYQQIDEKTVYMDKVVVADQFRRKGISDILMKEFFNRMKNENFEYVTTGFFRPEYFYKFGFKIERKYSGLAKKL
jgi:N-acetylglutamate synthase-like GNAT family acetyltransferase